jgi:ubiquinone biosynthesis protein
MLSALIHLSRLARAGFVFAREGVFALADPAMVPPAARPLLRIARLIERHRAGPGAVRLANALTRLGPSYVKLGQFLATRPDVVGPEIARDLESLQDKMAPFPQAQAEKIVADALGKPVGEIFVSFGLPLAAASIAQVHQAELVENGEKKMVAVKVLRPGIEARFRRDLETFFFAAKRAEARSSEAKRLRMVATVETLARSVTMEMDLRLEAAALSELAENTKDDPDFRVPMIEWDLTARQVLTTEWIDGIPLNDRARLAEAGHDFVRLSRIIIQSFLRQAIRDGFFHADLHPGNLFVDAGGIWSQSIAASWGGSG